MITYPSTHGVFDEDIRSVALIILSIVIENLYSAS